MNLEKIQKIISKNKCKEYTKRKKKHILSKVELGYVN